MSLGVNDPCFVPRLGNGVFVIVSENDRTREFKVRDEKGVIHDIYQVHCYRLQPKDHIAFKKAQAAKKAEEAEKIGRPKNRR